MDDLVQRAKDLAHRAHAGQVDKAGRPCIEHVARVAQSVSDDAAAEAVAWLHDVIEDCAQKFKREIHEFPHSIKMPVIRLTRSSNNPSVHYYRAIRSDPLALKVKLADIADNSSEERLALLDEKTAARLRRKYDKALKALTGEVA